MFNSIPDWIMYAGCAIGVIAVIVSVLIIAAYIFIARSFIRLTDEVIKTMGRRLW